MITTVYAPDLYTGDGSDDTFAITFDFMSTAANIKVSVTNASDVLEEKTQGTHYNVVGTNIVFTGGNIPASGRDIVIELSPDFLQSTEYPENTAAPQAAYENAVDKLTLIAQSLQEQVDRAVKVSVLEEAFDDLGTMSSQDSDAVAITGGTITGITDLALADGGTGASTAANARTNLGLGTMAVQNSNNVTITGGTIAATTFDINALTEDVTPSGSNDFAATYDASAGTIKKVKLTNLASAVADLVTDTTPQLGGGLSLNGFSIIFPSTTVSDCLDEDAMTSNSATAICTQQSIKAYVDNNTTFSSPILFSVQQYGPSNADGYFFIRQNDLLSSGASTAEKQAASAIVPIAGTISKLRVYVTTAPGVGESVVYTVYKNESSTALTCTISNTSTNASDLVNSFSVAAGDRLLILADHSASATAGASISASIMLDPS